MAEHAFEVHDKLDIERILHDSAGGAGELRVSIFAPMQRAPSGAQANAIRFKALARRARLEIERAGAERRLVRTIDAGLQAIVEDSRFWHHQADGLAVFASPHERFAFRVPFELPERIDVSEQYQLLPLLPLLDEEPIRAPVLALSLHRVRWFVSDRFSTQEVPLPEAVPRSLVENAGEQVEEQHLQLHTGPPGSPLYHGQGGGKDDREPEIEGYCRAIAKGLKAPLEQHADSLVLAGDRSLTARFQRVAGLPDSVDRLAGNFDDITPQDLHAQLEPLLKERIERNRRRITERFQAEQARNRVTYQPDAIAKAADEGRIAELLIGDTLTERPSTAAETLPVTPNDALRNDVAIKTLRRGGVVHSVPHHLVPDQRYIAARLRF